MLAVLLMASLITSPVTQPVQCASEAQGEAFRYGPYPQCLSGGWGSAKTWGLCLKAIYLSETYPHNRGVIARSVGKELRETTMSTFFRVCPPHLYRGEGGRRSDLGGHLTFSHSGSEILFLHLEDPDTQGIIRGLDINWFFIDQAEEDPEHMEEIFDLLLARLGRWDIATVPAELLERHARETNGAPWPYLHPESSKPVPPPYAMLAVNPDVETHWIYRRFHPDSAEHTAKTIPEIDVSSGQPTGKHLSYKDLGYQMFHMPSLSNKFLSATNKQFLLSRDEAFIRRNVQGLWGMPEGAIHSVDALSLIPGTPDLARYFREHCLLYRTLDHGDSAPTCCLWWAVDRDANVFCVAPNMKLLRADVSWVEAGDVGVGDVLAGFDEHPVEAQRRRWRRSIVLATQRVVQPSYRLTLDDGTQLTCSANHQWLVKQTEESVWRTTERLRVGQRLIRAADVWETDRSFGAGYLAAAFDGEGSFSHTNRGTPRLAFTQNSNAMLARVQAELAARGFEHGVYPTEGRHTTQVTLNRKEDVLRFLGTIRPNRLLPKFDVGQFCGFRGIAFPAIVHIEFLGAHETVAIETTTGTYVAEGLASHNCYREYYLGNALVSTHRANIAGLSEGERYERDLADPSMFYKLPQKQGGRWAASDEYKDVSNYPRETAIFWAPADNNEMGTRNRINEYLRVDPERVHPFTHQRGAPRLYFVTRNDAYPQGVSHALRELRAQRRVKIGTDLGKPIYSDERDPDIVDHGYDPCVSPMNRILTADLRWASADMLRPGDELIAFDEGRAGRGHSRKWRISVVEQVGRVRKPSYRLTFDDGTEVICSWDHLWLTDPASRVQAQTAASRRMWMRTEHLDGVSHWAPARSRGLPCGQRRVLKPVTVWDALDTRDAGYLAGFFDGEGNVSGSGVTAAQRPNAALRSACAALDGCGFKYALYENGGGGGKSDVRSIRVLGGLAEQLRFLGSIRPSRLLDNFRPPTGRFGVSVSVGVVRAEFIGETELMSIQTSSRTFICEGLASHNCRYFIASRAPVPSAQQESAEGTFSGARLARLKALRGQDR